MNIETIKALCPEFAELFGAHPFRTISATEQKLLQALAELQQNYDLLKDTYAGGDYFVKEMAKLRTERDQAQAQVAALRKVLSAANRWFHRPELTGIKAIDEKREKDYEKFVDMYEKVLEGPQATADAYTAKVRREERQKVYSAMQGVGRPLPEPAEAAERGGADGFS